MYFTAPYTTHPVYQNASIEKMFSFDLASGKTKKEDELAALLKPAKGEYTLDTWAGYEVNSDDARRVTSQIDGLGALLRPVGSYERTGDDPLYDLGGNAAEWVTGKDGTPKVQAAALTGQPTANL